MEDQTEERGAQEGDKEESEEGRWGKGGGRRKTEGSEKERE